MDRFDFVVIGAGAAGEAAANMARQRGAGAAIVDRDHAFPTLARVMGGVFTRAARELAVGEVGG